MSILVQFLFFSFFFWDWFGSEKNSAFHEFLFYFYFWKEESNISRTLSYIIEILSLEKENVFIFYLFSKKLCHTQPQPNNELHKKIKNIKKILYCRTLTTCMDGKRKRKPSLPERWKRIIWSIKPFQASSSQDRRAWAMEPTWPIDDQAKPFTLLPLIN